MFTLWNFERFLNSLKDLLNVSKIPYKACKANKAGKDMLYKDYRKCKWVYVLK